VSPDTIVPPPPERSVSPSGGWQTRDEIGFIDGLGTWCDPDRCITAADRIALLRSYRAGLMLRTRWAALNRETLVQHVDAAIARFSQLKPDAVL